MFPHEKPLTKDEIISEMNSNITENEYGKLEENLEAIASTKLLIAVVGQPGIGKSSFINMMLGLEEGDEGAALVGDGGTTFERKVYSHPQNNQLEFSDVPGFGTSMFKMTDAYLEKIETEKHDFFLIFYPTTITESEVWMMQKLISMGKKFALVRTKGDEMRHRKGKTLTQCIKEAKEKAKNELKEFRINFEPNTFVISNFYDEIEELQVELNALLTYMIMNFPKIKRDVIILNVHAKTDEIITKKEKVLLDNAWNTAAAMGLTSGTAIPGLDIHINVDLLCNELKSYLHAFGMNQEFLERYPEAALSHLRMLNKIKNMGLENFILFYIAKAPLIVSIAFVQDIVDLAFPVLGSLLTGTASFVCYYNFLRHIIRCLAEEAKILRKFHVEDVLNRRQMRNQDAAGDQAR